MSVAHHTPPVLAPSRVALFGHFPHRFLTGRESLSRVIFQDYCFKKFAKASFELCKPVYLEFPDLLAEVKTYLRVKGHLKENNLETLVDPDLHDRYIGAEVEQLIQVALICTQGSPMDRPKMLEVVRMLEGDGLAEKWDEWQKVEVLQDEVKMAPHLNFNWIIDSTENLQAVELSGPR